MQRIVEGKGCLPRRRARSGSGTGGGFLRGLVLPVTIIGAILVFVVPIPPALLDVLLSANLTVAVVVLLTTLAIRTPQEFSAFPTILLTTTLTRLVLNVATTRLVLTRGGEDGLDAAGGVIRAFGEVRGRRPGDRRRDPVLDPGRDPVRGDHSGGDPDQRGGRAVHARRAARPPDGDRRRLARRADRPARSPPPPRGGLSPGGFLRGHGRCQPVRPRRRDRRRRHPAGEHRRRAVPGHGQSRHEPGRGGQRLHQADDRRRPGQPGPGVPDLAGRGADRDPLVVIDRPEPRRGRSIVLAARRAGDGRRLPGPDGADAAAQAAAPGPGREPGRRRAFSSRARGAIGDGRRRPTGDGREVRRSFAPQSAARSRPAGAEPVRRPRPRRTLPTAVAGQPRPRPARIGWRTCCTSTRSSWRSASG